MTIAVKKLTKWIAIETGGSQQTNAGKKHKVTSHSAQSALTLMVGILIIVE